MHAHSSVLPSPTLGTLPFTRVLVSCVLACVIAVADIPADAHHRFIAEECDWGFTRFADLRKLYTPDHANGKTRPTIENDEVEITAFVRVLKDPTGVLWHNFINYDSKKETGYVGLRNQGATCYMNSLLQSFFCTNAFRKVSHSHWHLVESADHQAVYQIPTDNDDASKSIALALQRVFYLLQTSNQAVGTRELTTAFGWKPESDHFFKQHDVQELARILQDRLEAKMKGTPAEGSIPKLFKGQMKTYIKCVDVDYESSVVEDFYDLQLTIKGLKDLRASFQDYCSVETLDGDNKYQAEGYGLQTAKKGAIFKSFPPVLHLQLRRFEYDFEKDDLLKINDRHEFPMEIDLEEFLEEGADRSVPHIYKLHGVLVHHGDLNTGHYFALIKPEKDGRWLKFDDDRVTPVFDREVLEDNFGGGDLPNGPPHRLAARDPKIKKATNAYMLVYIRESELDNVLAPFTEADTPVHLKKRLDDEREQLEARRREKNEQHLYLTAKVITDDIFARHQGFDLASFDDKNLPATELPTFRVLKTETFATFRQRIASYFKISENDFRLWVLVGRQNKTTRPDVPISERNDNQTMEFIRNNMAARASDLRLYLDFNADHAKFNQMHSDPNNQPIMVFLKWFDCSRQTLLGQGKVFVNKNSKVSDLYGVIQEKMGWPSSTPIKLFEEIKAGMIEQVKVKYTYQQNEIQDGDIITYQVDMTEKEVSDLEAQSLYSSVPQFYDFLQNRVLVQFKPREEDPTGKAPEFDLMLSKKMVYDVMAHRVGDYLKHDPLKLRFTSSNPQTGAPKAIIKRALNQSVADITQTNYYSQHPNVILYYELLDISIIELETKKSLKIVWTGRNNKEEATHPFLLPKTSTFSDVADQLLKTVKLQPGGSGKIRIFGISNNGRSQREYTGAELIGNLPDPAQLYAEEIPVDELNAADNTRIVNLFHYSRDPSKHHGVPCKFVIIEGERFEDTKKRIQERIGVSDKDFSKFKFSLVQSTVYKQPSVVEDNDVLYDHKWQQDDALGLDHYDKRPNKHNADGIVMR